METSRFDLTDDEAILLDGRVRVEVQPLVDMAKKRINARLVFHNLSDADRKFLVALQEEARSNGILVIRHARITNCPVCKKVGFNGERYAKYKRRTSLHEKGDINFSKPLKMAAVDLAHRFVTVDGYVALGCCSECLERLRPDIRYALTGIRAQLPEQLTGVPSEFRKWSIRHCKKCDWEGSEEEMGEDYALMGGKYKSTCPNCGAKNQAFGPIYIDIVTGKFVVSSVQKERTPD